MFNHLQSIYRFRSIEFVAICFPVSLAFGVLSPPSAPISIVPSRVRVVFACRIDFGTQWMAHKGWMGGLSPLFFHFNAKRFSLFGFSSFFVLFTHFLLGHFRLKFPSNDVLTKTESRCSKSANSLHIEQITRSFPWESCVCVYFSHRPFSNWVGCAQFIYYMRHYMWRVCAHCSILIVNKEVILHKFYFHFEITRFRSVLTNKSTCNCAQTWTKKKEKKTKTKNNNRLKWPRLLRPNFE